MFHQQATSYRIGYKCSHWILNTFHLQVRIGRDQVIRSHDYQATFVICIHCTVIAVLMLTSLLLGGTFNRLIPLLTQFVKR